MRRNDARCDIVAIIIFETSDRMSESVCVSYRHRRVFIRIFFHSPRGSYPSFVTQGGGDGARGQNPLCSGPENSSFVCQLRGVFHPQRFSAVTVSPRPRATLHLNTAAPSLLLSCSTHRVCISTSLHSNSRFPVLQKCNSRSSQSL